MAIEHRQAEPAHELRLEGFKLLASVLALSGIALAAIVGAFLLGRWVESRARPAGVLLGEERGPLTQVVEPAPADAATDLTYFDDLEGREKALEPGREARPAATPPAAPAPVEQTVERSKEKPVQDGKFFVQVFAGRDRGAAERLVRELKGRDYPVRLLSEPEGQGSLYRVRVGGYPSEQAAEAAGRDLQSRGYSTWLVSGD